MDIAMEGEAVTDTKSTTKTITMDTAMGMITMGTITMEMITMEHDHHGDDHHGHDHHDDDHHGHDHHGHSHGGGGNQVININLDEEDIEVKMSSVKKLAQNINVRAAFIHVIGDLIQSVGVVIAGYIIKFEVNHSELCPCVCCSFNPGATEFI